MRESFTLRAGTCRKRSSPGPPALFVALQPASLPAPALGAWLQHAPGHSPSRADPASLHPSLLPLKQPCPPAVLCPAPFSIPHRSQSSHPFPCGPFCARSDSSAGIPQGALAFPRQC